MVDAIGGPSLSACAASLSYVVFLRKLTQTLDEQHWFVCRSGFGGPSAHRRRPRQRPRVQIAGDLNVLIFPSLHDRFIAEQIHHLMTPGFDPPEPGHLLFAC